MYGLRKGLRGTFLPLGLYLRLLYFTLVLSEEMILLSEGRNQVFQVDRMHVKYDDAA